jgi:hypothetical protein
MGSTISPGWFAIAIGGMMHRIEISISIESDTETIGRFMFRPEWSAFSINLVQDWRFIEVKIEIDDPPRNHVE